MGKLAASILSADFAYLADQVKLVEKHADFIHIDIMDAHFVPPLSIGPVVVESLRPVTGLAFHCHLMVDHPIALFDDLKAAGTDIVTAHVESADDPSDAVREARARGMRAGLALNPETPVDQVFPHLEELDRVIVMTRSSSSRWGKTWSTGVSGLRARPARIPRARASRTASEGSSADSTWAVTMSVPAALRSSNSAIGWSTIRWQWKARPVTGRSDSTTTGPMESGGTKWASMMSI